MSSTDKNILLFTSMGKIILVILFSLAFSNISYALNTNLLVKKDFTGFSISVPDFVFVHKAKSSREFSNLLNSVKLNVYYLKLKRMNIFIDEIIYSAGMGDISKAKESIYLRTMINSIKKKLVPNDNSQTYTLQEIILNDKKYQTYIMDYPTGRAEFYSIAKDHKLYTFMFAYDSKDAMHENVLQILQTFVIK